MSEATPTPTPTTPVAAQAPDDRQVLIQERANERATFLAQIQERDTQLATVLRERDTFKESISKLEPKAKLADELQIKVEGYINQGRENALIDKLRASLPGADPLALKGTLIALAEAGKAQRYSEDTDNEAKKILDLIKLEAPGLTRPTTSAGGSAAVQQTTTRPQRKSLVG